MVSILFFQFFSFDYLCTMSCVQYSNMISFIWHKKKYKLTAKLCPKLRVGWGLVAWRYRLSWLLYISKGPGLLAKGYPRLGEVVAGKGCAPIPLSMAEIKRNKTFISCILYNNSCHFLCTIGIIPITCSVCVCACSPHDEYRSFSPRPVKLCLDQ